MFPTVWREVHTCGQWITVCLERERARSHRHLAMPSLDWSTGVLEYHLYTLINTIWFTRLTMETSLHCFLMNETQRSLDYSQILNGCFISKSQTNLKLNIITIQYKFEPIFKLRIRESLVFRISAEVTSQQIYIWEFIIYWYQYI